MKPTDPTPTATTPVGSGQRGPPRPRAGDPLWYADKVIDKLHVKTCADGDGDGIGGPHGLTELVVNHSSDLHPWFQRARRAPKGSPERAFCVCSDDDTLHSGTRISFTDTEKSSCSCDEVAQQCCRHRIFGHQPDLNFDIPACWPRC